MSTTAFDQHVRFWESKSKKGESYVGRIGEDHLLQKKAIESLLMTRLKTTDFFTDGLDFGCGYGRFVPFLSNFCGHLWAVDIVPDIVERVRGVAPTVSALKVSHPIILPFKGGRIDFVWACLVFQHLVAPEFFSAACQEIRRVTKPGARMIVIDNAVDKAPHVSPRGPEVLTRELGFRPGWYADKITINKRPQDHWLIDGVKA